MNQQAPSTGPARSRWLLILIAMASAAIVGCPSNPSATKTASTQQTSETQAAADAQAIRSIGGGSWYDTGAGEYRPPRVAPDRDHRLRREGTLASPAGPASSATATGGRARGFNWPSGDAVAWAILILLGIALAAVALVLMMASMRHWKGKKSGTALLKAIEIDPARVADLPFEAQSEMEDPLAYAQHLVNQGRYEEATLFLYGYMLLALDRAGKIVLHRGKTNRMYLHELSDEQTLRDLLFPAMLAFEDVFFGRHRIEQQRFLKVWSTVETFHHALAPVIAELPAQDAAGVP